MSNLPNIPALSSNPTPAELRRAFNAVRVALLNIQSGGTSTSSSGTAINQTTVDSGSIDTTPPPIITGLASSGAFNSIILEWTAPSYSNHAYTEVHRAASDNLGIATFIGSTPAAVYVDTPPDSSLSTTYYYWVRNVTTAGITGDFQAVNGVSGSTADEPAYVLGVLANEIGSGEIKDSAISEGKIAALAVTAGKVAAGAISADKIAAAAVTAGKIAAGVVATGHLDALAVTAEKIAAGAITADKISANAVTAAKIAADAVTAAKIAADAIETQHIKTANITTETINGNAVTEVATQAYTNTISIPSKSDLEILNGTITTLINTPVAVMCTIVSPTMSDTYSGDNFSSYDCRVKIYRDTTLLYSISISGLHAVSLTISDTPGAGTFTYRLKVYEDDDTTWTISSRSLTVITAKR